MHAIELFAILAKPIVCKSQEINYCIVQMKPCPKRNITLLFKESICDLKKKNYPKVNFRQARAARMLCADKTRQMVCMIS